MEITLEIESARGALVANDMVGGMTPGRTASLPGCAVLELKQVLEHQAFDVPSVLRFTLSISTTIAIGLVTSWLYETLSARGRPHKLTIDRTEVRFDKGEITKALTERLESPR